MFVAVSVVLFLFKGCFASSLHLHLNRNRALSSPSFTVIPIGQATDVAFPSMHRDGGGGGVLRNRNWIIFSDTVTDKGFASNTYAAVSFQITPIQINQSFMEAPLICSVRPKRSYKANQLRHEWCPKASCALGFERERRPRLHLAQLIHHITIRRRHNRLRCLPLRRTLQRRRLR